MTKRGITKLLKRIVIGFVAFILAFLTLIGFASLTNNAFKMVGAAILVLLLVNFAGQALVSGRRSNTNSLTVQVVSSFVVVGVFYLLLLRPAKAERYPDLAGVEFWKLATGSRIAYMKFEPENLSHAEPILYLHGGPGVADMEGAADYFGSLRDEGYVVYVYDQLGSRRSSRLGDPCGYSVERDAADLEEIRKQIGPAQLVYLSGAGYNIFDDEPIALEQNLKAFLNDRPLPDRYTSTDIPPDFEKGY